MLVPTCKLKLSPQKLKFEQRRKAMMTAQSNSCGCRSENGSYKKLYPTEHEATEMKNYLFAKEGKSLRVYCCPCGHGWHLTHT